MSEKIYQFDKSLLNTQLSSQHEYVDKEGNRTMYRLVKGDGNLVMKDQSPNAQEIPFLVHNTIIPVKDVATQKFLESKPYFGRLINIYDPVSENEAKVEAVNKNLKTLMKVMQLENHELLGLGYQLFGQSALDKVKREKLTYDGLRVDVAAKANDDADKIEELLSKDNAGNTFFGLAFAKNIIKEDESGHAIYWGDAGGAKIMTVPLGVKPLEAIVEFSGTPEGATVKQLIGQKMEGKMTEKKVAAQKKEDATKAADKKDEATDEK